MMVYATNHKIKIDKNLQFLKGQLYPSYYIIYEIVCILSIYLPNFYLHFGLEIILFFTM